MAFGGVEEGGVYHAVGDGADAYLGSGVDADNLYAVAAQTGGNLGGADGHAVVVGVDEVCLGMTAQQRVGHRFGLLPAPVGRGACHHGASAGAQPACKAVVTARRRRRAGTARNLQRARVLTRQVQGIFGRRPPKSVIINDYAGGVAVAVDVAVKGYHRHAALVGLAYRRRQCLGLVGGDNEDIKVVVDKILDVSNLFFVAVVCRTYLHHGVLVQHDLAIDFFVHLLAPVVLAALRHTYFIYLLLGTSHRCRKNGNT